MLAAFLVLIPLLRSHGSRTELVVHAHDPARVAVAVQAPGTILLDARSGGGE